MNRFANRRTPARSGPAASSRTESEALIRFRKVIDLELKRGCDDRAVIGGIQLEKKSGGRSRRSLVSNAFDALEKLRHETLTAGEYADKDAPLEIRIDVDAEAHTLTITDNRTGKSYEVPIENDTIKALDLRKIKVNE